MLYVPRSERLYGRLAAAIAERAAAGIDAASVELVTAPDRFLAGEESALVSRLAGRPALPAYRPVRGLPRLAPGRTALVQNVETLAHLALIARYGAAWFRAAGTEAEPGTMLATLHLADGRASVTEVPLGTSLAGLLGLELDPAARPALARPCPAPSARSRPCSSAATTVRGCPLRRPRACRWPTRRCARSARRSGPGCWPPCPRTGAASPRPHGWPGTWPWNRPASAARASTACRASPPPWSTSPGRAPDRRARADLERWAGLVTGRGACHHPDGSVRFIRSALRVFAAEAGLHEQGRCSGTDPRPFLPVPAAPPATEEDWS